MFSNSPPIDQETPKRQTGICGAASPLGQEPMNWSSVVRASSTYPIMNLWWMCSRMKTQKRMLHWLQHHWMPLLELRFFNLWYIPLLVLLGRTLLPLLAKPMLMHPALLWATWKRDKLSAVNGSCAWQISIRQSTLGTWLEQEFRSTDQFLDNFNEKWRSGREMTKNTLYNLILSIPCRLEECRRSAGEHKNYWVKPISPKRMLNLFLSCFSIHLILLVRHYDQFHRNLISHNDKRWFVKPQFQWKINDA